MVYARLVFLCGMYQRRVDLDMLNAVKIKLAYVLNVSPSSEQK